LGDRAIARFLVERKGLDRARAAMLAAVSGGSLGKALAGEPDEAAARRDTAIDILARAAAEPMEERTALAESLAKGEGEAEALIEWADLVVRDLLMASIGRTDRLVNVDRAEDLGRIAETVPASALFGRGGDRTRALSGRGNPPRHGRFSATAAAIMTAQRRRRGRDRPGHVSLPGRLQCDAGFEPQAGDAVVAADRGRRYRVVCLGAHNGEGGQGPTRKVLRVAGPPDLKAAERNQPIEQKALGLCRSLVLDQDLPMKLLKAEMSLDGRQTTFYFSSEGRVDFRALVGIYKRLCQRIESGRRRDQAKLLGGAGPCDKSLLCLLPPGVRARLHQGGQKLDARSIPRRSRASAASSCAVSITSLKGT
jgi:hypothetical protein